MKTHVVLFFLLVIACFSVISCQQADTCEDDSIDEKWGEVVDNDSCTKEQKGEAYLALGGFDSFDLLANSEDVDFIDILGLTKSNWATKYSYFNKAVEAVTPVSESTESDSRKTVYFFGSFLRLYTYVVGTLDGSTIDGNIESSEIESFTGVSVVNSGGDDGTTLTSTSNYQFKSGGNYYIIVDATVDTYYTDDNADGSEAGESVLSASEILAVSDTSSWTEINQVMYMIKLSDPLASTGGSVDADKVTTFSNNLLSYMDEIGKSLDAIGIDASHDARTSIDEFRGNLDNGTEGCVLLENNPALRVVEMIASNSQQTALDNYAEVNIFSVSQLQELGETDTLPETDPFGSSLVPAIKMLFLTESSTYVPNWEDATPDVLDAMTNLDNFNPTEVQANDGNIAFSEIICLSETTD